MGRPVVLWLVSLAVLFSPHWAAVAALGPQDHAPPGAGEPQSPGGAPAGAALQGACSGQNPVDIAIPDALVWRVGDWAESYVTTNCDECANISPLSSVLVDYTIRHPFAGDLEVALSGQCFSTVIRYREGGSADDIIVTGQSVPFPPDLAFTGWSYWRLSVRDWSPGDAGYLDWWKITVNYTPRYPAAPELTWPPDYGGLCDTAPTFTWEAVAGAERYRLQVDNHSDFSSPEIDQTLTRTSYTPRTALAPGVHYWRVFAGNACGWGSSSAARRVRLAAPTLAAPALVSPGQGASACDTTPTFTWQAVPGADYYMLWVSSDSAFPPGGFAQSVAGASYTLGTPLPPGVHYWRVYAVNSCAWSATGETRSLSIVTTAPAPPTLVAPAHGAVLANPRPQFAWTAVAGATGYRLQVDNDPDFGSPEINQVVNGASYTLAAALAPGVHHWRVLALNACGLGSPSAVRTLTIAAPTPAPRAIWLPMILEESPPD